MATLNDLDFAIPLEDLDSSFDSYQKEQGLCDGISPWKVHTKAMYLSPVNLRELFFEEPLARGSRQGPQKKKIASEENINRSVHTPILKPCSSSQRSNISMHLNSKNVARLPKLIVPGRSQTDINSLSLCSVDEKSNSCGLKKQVSEMNFTLKTSPRHRSNTEEDSKPSDQKIKSVRSSQTCNSTESSTHEVSSCKKIHMLKRNIENVVPCLNSSDKRGGMLLSSASRKRKQFYFFPETTDFETSNQQQAPPASTSMYVIKSSQSNTSANIKPLMIYKKNFKVLKQLERLRLISDEKRNIKNPFIVKQIELSCSKQDWINSKDEKTDNIKKLEKLLNLDS